MPAPSHRLSLLLVGAVALGLSALAAAQSATGPPRTADGQPDIQGFWREQEGGWPCSLETGLCPEDAGLFIGQSGRVGVPRATKTETPVSAITDPPGGPLPYQPWARIRKQEIEQRYAAPLKVRDVKPETICVTGLPYLYYSGREFNIVQTPGYVVMSWERTSVQRVIRLDSRPRLAPAIKLYLGDARGRWEGNTLVVETTNLKDWSWFDNRGSFHSDALTLLERFTIVDASTIRYTVTVNDPNVFTRPWTMTHAIKRAFENDPDYEFMEYACVEGERSAERMIPNLRR